MGYADLPERFHAKVTIDAGTGCHVWTAAKTRDGYGRFRLDGRMQRAHRVAFVAERGPIPDGMHVDHMCNRSACVNPAHLQLATPAENIRYAVERDGTHKGARTHCPRGHVLTQENCRPSQLRRGKRKCLTCAREHTGIHNALASAFARTWGVAWRVAAKDPRVHAITREAWRILPDAERAEWDELAAMANRLEAGGKLTKREKLTAYRAPVAA